MYGLTQVVGPVQLDPPHCAKWAAPVVEPEVAVVVVVALVVVAVVAVVALVVVVVPEPEPELPELKVDPSGPTLMFE